jgi:O-antigen/teichoic acid export membrane protein
MTDQPASSPGDTPNPSLSGRTAKAGAWSISGRLLAKVLDFIALLILARFLGPADFGLVAMAMTSVFIVETVLDLPITTILLREEHLTDDMFNTAFTLGLMRSLIVAAVLGALAWPMSLFYNEPRLLPLIACLAISPIMRGLISPRLIMFAKRFDFSKSFILDVASKSVSLIVVATVAILTRSYWALAIGTITTAVVFVSLTYVFAPMKPSLTFKEWPRFANVVGWSTLTQFISSVNWQMDRLILPRYIDLVPFGRFTAATDMVNIPYQAIALPTIGPINAAFATLIQSPKDLGAAYLKASAGIPMLITPVLLSLAMLSTPVLNVLFGDKWLEAAPYLTALALTAMIVLPAFPLPCLAMVLNRNQFVSMRGVAELAVKLPIMLFAASKFGVYGAIATQAIAATAVVIFSMFSVRTLIGLKIRDQIGALVPYMLGLGAMAATIYGLKPLVWFDKGIWLEVISIGLVVAPALIIYTIVVFTVWGLAGRPNTIEHTIVHKGQGIIRRLRRRA